jgi:hypothetical protein
MLMSYFTQNNIRYTSFNPKTKKIISLLYQDILNSYYFLQKNKNLYSYEIKNIQNVSDVVKPTKFNNNSFPLEIRKTIDLNSVCEIKYSFRVFNKNVKIYFVLDEPVGNKIKVINKNVELIIMWLYILNKYSSANCAQSLNIYIYLTKLEKQLPNSNIDILNEIHINTAFTTTCPVDSEIVIFRKEEWFKVFIHETFHTFGLDFSNMDNSNCKTDILDIFKVDSEVNLYEAYSEFWAEIINALFCAFQYIEDKTNYAEFIKNAEFLVNFELNHSYFQLAKVLNFMGLNYQDLYSSTKSSHQMRVNLYKESTNVLAYYIIKTILLNSYQDCLLWCSTHNSSLINFKKTLSNTSKFCLFIKQKYKIKSMLLGVENAKKKLLLKSNNNFINNNLRMSLCELG